MLATRTAKSLVDHPEVSSAIGTAVWGEPMSSRWLGDPHHSGGSSSLSIVLRPVEKSTYRRLLLHTP